MDNEKDGRRMAGEDEKKGDAFDWLQCVITALVLCILIFTFVGRTVSVVGPSMEQTLTEGDRLIISKLFYTPKYGDIVVLRKDSFARYPIIKRVIATEGQVVDIRFADEYSDGVVYVDDVALEEPYINEEIFSTSLQDFTRPVTVPEGCVFVMGDNRNRSTDSRDKDIGCVDTRYIIGKALFRLTPFAKFGRVA